MSDSRIVLHYAICHYAVDFTCVATMLSAVAPLLGDTGLVSTVTSILVYDLVAFCLQLPLGAALDHYGHAPRAALISFALVAAGVLASLGQNTALLFASILLVASGNALFHCAGGVDVLGISDGHAAPSGIFISTGAAGVFFGARAAGIADVLQPALIALMAICAVLVLWIHETPSEELRAQKGPAEPPVFEPVVVAALVLLAATVALRSYAGLVMSFPWKGDFILALVSIIAVVAGKALGGILSDSFSLERISVVSLGISAPFFVLAWELPWAGIIATFLFNFTMPITLISLAKLLPDNHGLAFGIASFSLALGAIPAFMGLRLAHGTGLAVLSLVSLVFLLTGLFVAKVARA